MIVGVLSWELSLAGCHSLKDKRRIVKSLKDRLHQRFNVSAAEVDHQDAWQQAALAVSVVSPDRRHAEEVLTSCDRLVQGEVLAHIIRSEATYH